MKKMVVANWIRWISFNTIYTKHLYCDVIEDNGFLEDYDVGIKRIVVSMNNTFLISDCTNTTKTTFTRRVGLYEFRQYLQRRQQYRPGRVQKRTG